MADSYAYFRVRAAGRDTAELVPRLQAQTLPAWSAAGATCWGIWQGLFGVASNELLIMAAAPGDRVLAPLAAELPAGAVVADTLELLSTVRPAAIEPLVPEGLHVFRLFDVAPQDCDEVVALSRQAWETFETSDAYRSRPLGLFRPRPGRAGAAWADDGPVHDRMLLLTWYDGFQSWQTSRSPAPEARASFRRRHALTAGSVALATRLIG